MQNAHLRLGLLEYQRATEKISTRIRVRVDRYVGEDRKAHLLSVFGNDSDIGAITAAVHERATFTLTFPWLTASRCPSEQQKSTRNNPASRHAHRDPGPWRAQLNHERRHEGHNYKNSSHQSRIHTD